MDTNEHPEWLRPKTVPALFGIGRTKLYELIAEGKVKSVSLRKRGQQHGTRLVSYDSLVAYLESIAEGGGPSNQQPPTAEVGTVADTGNPLGSDLLKPQHPESDEDHEESLTSRPPEEAFRFPQGRSQET